MNELNKIFELEPEQILSTLPKFQVSLIKEWQNSGNDYLAIADKWLNATPQNTFGFGGEKSKNSIYREKIMEELEKFVCGDEKYEEERNKLVGLGGDAIGVIIGAIAVAIGSAIGTTAAFISPIIALILLAGGKISKNGWCEARKELRAKSNV